LKNNPARLTFICGAGAQLSWLYAWATFLIFTTFQRVYPLPETLGIFSLAVFLTLFCRGRGWRVIQVIGVHLAALAFIGLWVVNVFYYPLEPLWNQGWLTDFFSRPREPLERFLLVFVLGYTIGFWVAGTRFALQAKSYISACSRFDRGVMAFFCLFLIKLIMQTRMGVEFHDSIPILLIFPFFIFSLTEIGLARKQRNDQPTDYLSGYYTVGVLASFTIGALILGSAIFTFFLPHLTAASGVGYDLIKSTARPLAPILIAVITFLLGHAKSDPTAWNLSPSTDATGIPEPGEFSTWIKVLMWGGGILVLAIGLAAVGLILWYTIRWLFQKRVGGQESRHQWKLLSWWKRLKAFLTICYEWILRTAEKKRALEFYAALSRWGRYSGLSPKSNETPMEYGLRLSHRFPKVKTEIMLIIEMLHWEVYGETSLSPLQIKRIGTAWKKLHSPLTWPFRIKSLMHPTAR
jgi:hypothetical protein